MIHESGPHGCTVPAPAEYVLRAEGIGKSFGGVEVLSSASLWAEPGRVTTLLGRNGCGKTTLMRIAAGRLGPDWGVVKYRGRVRVAGGLAAMARDGLMFVPQGSLLCPSYRVEDHFRALRHAFPVSNCAFSAPDLDAAVERFRLGPLLEQRTWTLSGGEKMRVSVALAVARRPLVLLIDEPFVGVQPKDQEMVADALRALADEGCAVVTSGHDVRVLMEVSDAIIWCTAGTTHHLGTPADAASSDQFRREYLGAFA